MWKETNNALYKQFTFKDFKEAFAFMEAVAAIAEEQGHHPKWQNEWNTVEIWLSTHSAGNKVTEKDQTLANAIDKLQEETTQEVPMISTLPKIQTRKELKLYSDGGSRGNPGPSASGYVLMDMENTIISERGVYLGITTNNQAEYHSLRLGLEEAKKLGAREVEVYMDSMLVVNQMKGIFKVKNRDLWPIHEAAKELAEFFKKITYTHIPRELNKLADAEVNKVLDSEAEKK
ncbi:hypothetical protein BH23PAT1_BH23PAT1_1640 [soil metagenome]